MPQSLALRILKPLVYVDWKRRRRMLRREAWFAIIAAHLALLSAWLTPGTFDTSSSVAVVWTWAMMLIRVLYFQIGALLLVIAIVATLTRHFRMATACVPIVLLTVVWPYLHSGPRATAPAGAPTLRIISANLLMVNYNTQPILDEIAQSNADIVFLQEYTEHWDKAFKARFATTYPYDITYPQEDSFGGAIFSRLPFVGKARMDDDIGKWSVVQLAAVVDVHGTPVECRNIHLTPPRKMDYTIEHFDEMRDFVKVLASEASRPVIVAGDFNFTGSTLQAQAIASTGFRDAFDDAGTGRGSTWPVNSIFRYLPGIRLDHIFLSPKLQCRSITQGTGYGSDHRPLVADITLVGP